MNPNPLGFATPPPLRQAQNQNETLLARTEDYRRGEINAACVMSLGSGRTAPGVAAMPAFTRRSAPTVTPGRVLRGTIATALIRSCWGSACQG